MNQGVSCTVQYTYILLILKPVIELEMIRF